jgi:hypothetical protein
LYIIDSNASQKLVKDLHTSGFKAPIFDRQTLADIGQTEHWTFEERIDMICRLLRISKNVAVTVMVGFHQDLY